jgi:hypothetical protein
VNRHRRFREMLARRIELTPADEQRLRAHLEGCPECRETAAAYEHQWKLLRSLPPLETPPTLRASVLNRIHAAPQPAVRWYRRRSSLMAPLAAAALLALAGIAWVAGSRVIAPSRRIQLATRRPPRPGIDLPNERALRRLLLCGASRPSHQAQHGSRQRRCCFTPVPP